MKSENYVYANIYFYNGTGTNRQISYNETRTTPIVDNGDDYELAIVRYSLPIHLLPLFIYDSRKYTFGGTLANQNALDDYLVHPSKENNYPEGDIRSRYVMNIRAWMNYLNDKFFDLLNGFVQLSIENDRLVLIVSQEYVQRVDNAATQFLVMNEALYVQFFSGFPATYDAQTGFYTLDIHYTPSDYVFHDKLQYVDPSGFVAHTNRDLFVCRDSFNSLSSWGLIRRVVFLTNGIKILNETISSKIYGENQKSDNSGSITILTDFEIPYTSIAIDKNYLFYQPHELRYIAIKHQGPIQKLDLDVYFEDPMTSTFYPLPMRSNTDLSLKLLFRKKKELRMLHI